MFIISRKIDIDIDKNKLNKQIWKFSYPNIITLLFQHGFGFFEGTIVSLKSTGDLSVLSIGFPFVFIITNMAFGLSVGVNFFISKAVGEDKEEGINKSFFNSIFFSTVFGLIMGLSLFSLLPFILIKMSGISEVMYNHTLNYLKPYFFGSILIYIYSCLISVLRGMGKMKFAAKTSIIVIILNGILDLILLYGFNGFGGLGVYGIGLGSIIARFIGIVLMFNYFRKKQFIRIKEMKINYIKVKHMKELFLILVPIALSKSIQPVAVIFLNRLLLTFSDIEIAARGLGSRIDMIFFIPSMVLAFVVITFTGKLRGEENWNMIYFVVKRVRAIALIITTAFTAVIVLFPETIWTRVTDDPELIAAGIEYTTIFGLSYPFAALDIINSSGFNGLGLGYPTLIMTSFRIWVISIPLSYLFTSTFHMPVGSIWLSYALGNVLAALISTVWLNKRILSNITLETVRTLKS